MPTVNQERSYAAIRTVLIGYGITAYGFLVARSELPNDANVLGGGGSVSVFLLSGIGLQVLLILGRIVIRRVVADRSIATQALHILELIGDGATVLLFALGTLGAVVHVPEQF